MLESTAETKGFAPQPQDDALIHEAMKTGSIAKNALIPPDAQCFMILEAVSSKDDNAADIYLAIPYDDVVSAPTPNPKVYRLSYATFAANLIYLREVCGCANISTPILPPADGSLIMGIVPSSRSRGMYDDGYIELLEDYSGVALWGSYEGCMGSTIE